MDENTAFLDLLSRNADQIFTPEQIASLMEYLSGTPAVRAGGSNARASMEVDMPVAGTGATLSCLARFTNNTQSEMDDVQVLAHSDDLSLVPGSVRLNGQAVADGLLAGGFIPAIAAGETVEISFQETVDEAIRSWVENRVEFSFGGDSQTASAITRISNSVFVRKTADRTFASPGDIVSYEIDIANLSNFDIGQVTLSDLNYADCMGAIMPYSLEVNGVPYPDVAFMDDLEIPDIPAKGGSGVVRFKTQIPNDAPEGYMLMDEARASYEYAESPGSVVSRNAVSLPCGVLVYANPIGEPGPKGETGPCGTCKACMKKSSGRVRNGKGVCLR